LILCVLAAVIPAGIINFLLPPSFFIIGLAAGAVCAGFAISAACGMSVKRASIAAALFLACEVALTFATALFFGPRA
jgi:hypothetical protein